MAASFSAVKAAPPNRRRRVRHKIQTPAYATFAAASSGGAMLDLHEILNISEEGIAIQCDTALELGRRINLCLDLAECPDHIYTTGLVIWSSANGRSGLRFAELPPFSLFRLREWLFLNAMSAVATANEAGIAIPLAGELAAPRPSYTDTLAALTAVQREVEALGTDFGSALRLVAARAQTLTHSTGAAIALMDQDPQFAICRASSGPDAPPIGAKLQVGSGFSGECVRSGMLLRCDDTETDSRVDAENCRALGIRSILAAPLRAADRALGILEVFSDQAHAFGEGDERIVQRLSEMIVAVAHRAARAETASSEYVPPLQPSSAPAAPAATRFVSTPGSVLFADSGTDPSAQGETDPRKKKAEVVISSNISLPLSLLYLLFAVAGVIALVLGYTLAPLIHVRLADREHVHLPTVLASTKAPKTSNASSEPNIDTASFDQLRQMAQNGDPMAQNALGIRYAQGDGVRPDDREAVSWFTKAAEQGYIPAESKLGSFYYNGRGVPQNFNEAYRWVVLARASGDETSKTLAPLVAQHLTPEQATSIELDADRWLQQHASAKTVTAH